MADSSSDSIPPELRVLLDLEVTVKGRNSVVDHQKLQDTLAETAGVLSVAFLEDRIAIQYDAESISKAQLVALIKAAGFTIGEADSEPPMPHVDPA